MTNDAPVVSSMETPLKTHRGGVGAVLADNDTSARGRRETRPVTMPRLPPDDPSPIVVRVLRVEEDLERGEPRIPPSREPCEGTGTTPIAIAVPVAEASSSPRTVTSPPAKRGTTTKVLLSPVPLWSLESSPAAFRGILSVLCGLTILLAFAILGAILAKGIVHHTTNNSAFA